MEDAMTKIRERVAKLENLIDSFSPETETPGKTTLKELTRELDLIVYEFSPKDFYSSHNITKSEARYLGDLLDNCHKKLSNQQFPKASEGKKENEDFIEQRMALGSIVFTIKDMLRFDWFKNDEVRLPKAQRILNRKYEIEKLEQLQSQSPRPGTWIAPLIIGLLILFYSLKGSVPLLIAGLFAVIYSIYVAIKGSMAKEPYHVLEKKIANLKEEIGKIETQL